jgi:hypothetical protein
MALPIKTTGEDLVVLADYLDRKVGMVPLTQLRTTVPAPHGDNRKIEAMRYIGLLERTGEEVKLTDAGHDFARTTGEKREQVIADRLKTIPLYLQTLELMHFQKQLDRTPTQIAQIWADKHADKLEGAAGAALTDAAVFFMRLVGLGGLGKFVPAGNGRITHVEADAGRLAIFVTGVTAMPGTEDGKGHSAAGAGASNGTAGPRPHAPVVVTNAPDPNAGLNGTLSSTVNVNIEVHVAGDAKPDVVRDIFRNMRKYVLGLPDIDEKKS